MRDERTKILYVDDIRDSGLERYLDHFETGNDSFSASDMEFDTNSSLRDLILSPSIKDNDIILIDSRLFEESSSSASTQTGEVFKLMMRRYYPYKVTIVITRNDIGTNSLTVKKFSGSNQNFIDWYEERLGPLFLKAQKEIREDQTTLSDLQNENSGDIPMTVAIDEIADSIDSGDPIDTPFKKEDIDRFVKLFQEVKNTIEK